MSKIFIPDHLPTSCIECDMYKNSALHFMIHNPTINIYLYIYSITFSFIACVCIHVCRVPYFAFTSTIHICAFCFRNDFNSNRLHWRGLYAVIQTYIYSTVQSDTDTFDLVQNLATVQLVSRVQSAAIIRPQQPTNKPLTTCTPAQSNIRIPS